MYVEEQTANVAVLTILVLRKHVMREPSPALWQQKMMKFTEGVTPQQHNMKTVSMEGTFVIAWVTCVMVDQGLKVYQFC